MWGRKRGRERKRDRETEREKERERDRAKGKTSVPQAIVLICFEASAPGPDGLSWQGMKLSYINLLVILGGAVAVDGSV